jgi:hypothetical protein
MHYFKFDKPNYVSIKQNSKDEYVEFKLIESWEDGFDLPPRLNEPKISFERQEYLFEKIRSFVVKTVKIFYVLIPLMGCIVIKLQV